MTIPVVAFFNNKGGVGATSLVYHLSWMYQNLGLRVVAADLDPQASLTGTFLDDYRLQEIWVSSKEPNSVFKCVQPLFDEEGDIIFPEIELIDEQLFLFPGDVLLSGFEEEIYRAWLGCSEGKIHSFRVISAFWRLLQNIGINHEADIILMDLGPNLGAINRAALIAADYVVVPLRNDIWSLQGIKNIGSTLKVWREEWQERLQQNPNPKIELPPGKMQPIGYVVQIHPVRLYRPLEPYERLISHIPSAYRQGVLTSQEIDNIPSGVVDDPNCLASFKYYPNLTGLAQEAHKPMFALKPADGAMGSYLQAVISVYQDFKKLATKIAQQINIKLPVFY